MCRMCLPMLSSTLRQLISSQNSCLRRDDSLWFVWSSYAYSCMCVASQHLSHFVNEQSPCIYHCPPHEQYAFIDAVVTLASQCEANSLDVVDVVATYNPLSKLIVGAVGLQSPPRSLAILLCNGRCLARSYDSADAVRCWDNLNGRF
jgi:hypothetical protein